MDSSVDFFEHDRKLCSKGLELNWQKESLKGDCRQNESKRLSRYPKLAIPLERSKASMGAKALVNTYGAEHRPNDSATSW